jgi:hypothetical protein
MKTRNKLLAFIALLLIFVSSCSIEDATEEIFQPLTVLVDVEDGAWHRTGLDLNRNGILDDSEITSSVFIPDGLDGTNGEDGYNTETRITPSDMGYTLSFGLDLNRNGILEDNEITNSIFIANGIDGTNGTNGHNSLIRVEIVEDGHILYIGLDTNNDGLLQDSEVTSQIKVLNGINGTNGSNGSDGTNGTNGLNFLIHIVVLNSEMEHECTDGGVRVYYGSDTNGDGVLNEDEFKGYHDICRCECECDHPVPYYEIEPICCDDYENNTPSKSSSSKTVCEVTGFKVTKGIVGKPELETIEIFCN